jgi:hypothetical protein
LVKLAKESVVGFISVTGTVIFLAIMDCSSPTSKCSEYNFELFIVLGSAEAMAFLFVSVSLLRARARRGGILAEWRAQKGNNRM